MDDNLKKSNPTPTSQKSEIWELESGKWQQESSGLGFKLVETNTGQKVYNHLTNADLQVILNLPKHPENEDWLYPPEFEYCAETGKKLLRQDLSDEKAWIPPFGVLPINERKAGVVRGLNQSDFTLNLSKRNDSTSFDFKLSPLPNGNFQFFSIRANTIENLLIAFDPFSGALFAYLPEQNEWSVLEHKSHKVLIGTQIDLALWRCESQTVGYVTRLYLPTDQGLALLTLDVLSMSFEVEYFGGGQCVAAPIFYLDSILQLVLNQAGEVELLKYSLRDQDTKKIVLERSQDLKLTQIQAPIITTHFVVWLCKEGQLILERANDSVLKFMPWPLHIQPVFGMGCPFLSTEGQLYQLCRDDAQANNSYVQINNNSFGAYKSETARICSGRFNFYLAKKEKDSPWTSLKLSTGNSIDSGVVSIIVPLFESIASENVLCLKFERPGDKSVSSLFDTNDPERAVFVLTDSEKQTSIFSYKIQKAWLTKFFIHKNALWLYHSGRDSIVGWRLGK